MKNRRPVIIGFIFFVISVGAALFFRSPKATLTSTQKAEIADVRRQLQGARRGDVILYKGGSLCCITFVNAESLRCVRFVGGTPEISLVSDDRAMSKIMHVATLEDPADLNHNNYKAFALRYLQQPLPH